MLLEEGIPSILRRTRGFDVPDFLAAGPRDVIVPETGVEAAATCSPRSTPVGRGAGERARARAPMPFRGARPLWRLRLAAG